MDVLLDLRAGCEYGKVASVELTDENSFIFYTERDSAKVCLFK